MMLLPSTNMKVFLRLGVTDMRKSINGLSILVEDFLEQNPFSGNLFVFCNRRKDILKILYWERNGFCLWQKRLEKHRFTWPSDGTDTQLITQKELMWLLDGLDFSQVHPHESLTYLSAS